MALVSGCGDMLDSRSRVEEELLISVVINPDDWDKVYHIRLSLEGMLTTSVGRIIFSEESYWLYYGEDHLYSIKEDFSHELVRETRSVELTNEQMQELIELTNQINADDFRKRGGCEGCWYVDVIHMGNVYQYIVDMFDDEFGISYMPPHFDEPVSPHMASITKKLFEYSPIPIW